MTAIVSVTTRLVPVRNRTLNTSYASERAHERTHLFLRLEADDGHFGIAEGAPLPHFTGETAEAMDEVINNRLIHGLLGQDVFATEVIQRRLEKITPGHYSSKSTLMNALLDLQGRSLGMNVSRLLGGPMRHEFPVTGAAGLGPIHEVLSILTNYHRAGLRTFKLKIGVDVHRDAELIAAVRSEFGSTVEIRADANGAYSRSEARRFIELTRHQDLQYIEQPLPREDITGLAALRRNGNTPIAVDESLHSLRDAAEIIRCEAADVFIVKLIKFGGLHAARKVAAIAEGSGITCVAVSPYETALGASANLHLIASSAAFPWAIEVGAGPTAIDLAGMANLPLYNGFTSLPDGTGMGVSLTQDFFADDTLGLHTR